MKKFFVLLLAVMMTLTLSFAAFATEEDPNDNFEALSCKRISDNELEIVFSEALNSDGISHPFTAIRWCTVDDTGFMTLAWEFGTPMQFTPQDWAFAMTEDGADDTTKVILTFAEGDLDEYMWHSEYAVYLCMEEKEPKEVEHVHLYDVVSESGKQLLSNRPGPNNDWDGVYLPIDPGEYTAPEDNGETEPDPPQETEYDPSAHTTAAPETKAPETKAPETNAPETKAPEKKSGCGSVVASLAIVPMLLAAAYVAKKH